MRKPEIAVFGANPSWQKTLSFEHLLPGEVNRARSADAYASGKGVNFCRAATCHGLCRTRLFQFAGGGNGRRHEAGLRAEKIPFRSIRTAAETRCCLTCLDRTAGTMTELIEPSHPVTPEEAVRMLAALDEALIRCSGVAITGSLPDGTDPGLYCEVARRSVRRGVPLLVDAVSGILPALDVAKAFLLKVNRSELLRLTGEQEILPALHKGLQRWPEAILAVTAGPDAAFLATEGVLYRYELPAIEVISPLGAGDTCSAVFLSEILCGTPPAEAFGTALAAANANCLTPKAGEFAPAERDRLRNQITIRHVETV